MIEYLRIHVVVVFALVVFVRGSFQVDGAGRWRLVGIRDDRNSPRRVVSDGIADAFDHSGSWGAVLQRDGSCARHGGGSSSCAVVVCSM